MNTFRFAAIVFIIAVGVAVNHVTARPYTESEKSVCNIAYFEEMPRMCMGAEMEWSLKNDVPSFITDGIIILLGILAIKKPRK